MKGLLSTRKRRVGPILLLAATAAATAALVQPATAQAATSVSVNGCTVYTSTPYIRWWGSLKFVQANMTVYCSATRSGRLSMWLKEWDFWTNDTIRESWVNFTIPAGSSQTFSIIGRCTGWDPFGSEQVYAAAHLWIDGAQTDFARSPILYADC